MEAYRWWNSQLRDKDDPDAPPTILIPRAARSVWSHLCPIFLLFVIDESDLQSYWEAIQAILLMFDPLKDVPHPIASFPAFIRRVYEMRDFLVPRTVHESVQLIDRFGFHNSAHCFLYQTPVFMHDQTLYLDTILAMHSQNHRLWADFVSSPRLVSAFFSLYSAFATPLPRRASLRLWTHRFYLVEVFSWIVLDGSTCCTEPMDLVNWFLSVSLPIALTAPLQIGLQIFRPILSIFRKFWRAIVKEECHTRVIAFIESLDLAHSPHFHFVFRFFFSLRPLVVRCGHLLHLLCDRGIGSIEDIRLLLSTIDSVSSVSACLFLVRAAIANKLWHRACFAAVVQIAEQFGCRPDFRETLSLIIRRLFIFISISETRGRYRVRTLLLCESLSTLRQTLGLPWVEPTITGAASSVASRRVPPYFRALFAATHEAVDIAVLNELGVFSGAAVELKAFPFDPRSRRAVLVPAVAKVTISPPANQSSCRRLPAVTAVSAAPKAAPSPEKKRRWKSPKKGKRLGAIVVRQPHDADPRLVAFPAGRTKGGPHVHRIKPGRA
jgi:hypothetical protein